jgi:hypothetical protein
MICKTDTNPEVFEVESYEIVTGLIDRRNFRSYDGLEKTQFVQVTVNAGYSRIEAYGEGEESAGIIEWSNDEIMLHTKLAKKFSIRVLR